MQVSSPLISVLMTAFNREEYIAEAIESVLVSTYSNFELIIVDDCSADNTLAIARSYADKDLRVSIYSNEQNLGDYPNRNKAATYAQGKYLKYVDSDDKICPFGLQVMLDAMERFPEAAFGFCDITNRPAILLPVLYSGEEALRTHFLKGGLLLAGPGISIIRRDIFESFGGFISKRYIGDYETWLRLCLHYPVAVFSQGLYWQRTHKGQEYDVGKLSYYSLNYNLHRDFILHTKNLFSVSERKKILYNYRILFGRRIFQRLLKWYGFKKTTQTIRDSNETYLVFLWAFMPMKK